MEGFGRTPSAQAGVSTAVSGCWSTAGEKQCDGASQSASPHNGPRQAPIQPIQHPINQTQYHPAKGQGIDRGLLTAAELSNDDSCGENWKGFKGILLGPMGTFSAAFKSFKKFSGVFIFGRPQLMAAGKFRQPCLDQGHQAACQYTPISDAHYDCSL